jgi:rSAM/selenodomain-associated transferase 1
MFAKYWQAGAVKTRLAAAVGDAAASRLYRQFVATTAERFADVGQQRTIYYWPAHESAAFAQVAGKCWQTAAQCEGDLGTRMQDFFQRCFAAGNRRVVLIGSDSPTLPTQYVRQAFDLLESRAVVLGPSEDGGYYLVGARGRTPPIFAEIAWSTPGVWRQTVRCLKQAGISFGTLPTWYDVDDYQQLVRMADELRAASTGGDIRCELRPAVEEAVVMGGRSSLDS